MTQKEMIAYIAGKKPGTYTVEDLCTIHRVLRGEGGCPWDREQTHESIRSSFIEETYEVIEAIDNKDPKLMREELGDVLLQVVFHAQIAAEDGEFDINDVANDICEKLVHRHPHVFGNVKADTPDEVIKNWDAIKSEEKHRDTLTSKLRAVPPALPALMRAQKVGKKASFFDFDTADAVIDKLHEETAEVAEAAKSGDPAAMEEEIGDLLLTVTSLARKLGVDSEKALGKAVNKFIDRFERVEKEAAKEGRRPDEMTMPELDAIWDRIKHEKCE